ncbi:hypothetical protein SAMN06265374_2336 [Roseibium denhamense]|uniref:Uncharacterized protein n=1 Tax=Roseibium denhamense TaxID=76305 RepID=A0ABY1P2F2_9HYPH|nr:hypothetical protein SAMN06265374_2336 [Roseibium denhamense]
MKFFLWWRLLLEWDSMGHLPGILQIFKVPGLNGLNPSS